MRYIRGCLLVLLSLALFASLGCTSPKAAGPITGLEVKDQLGRTVKLDKVPQRIISLAPGNTEILYALGLADRVVGVTDYDNYPPEVKQKPSIGGFSTPSIEKVVALSPDLILAAPIHEKQVIPQLEAKAMTVLALAPKNIDQIMEAINMVGKVTGKEKEASNLVSSLQGKIKSITDKTNRLTATQRPRVFYIVWHDPLMTAGAGTFYDELIQKAGGINIAGNLNDYQSISLETIVAANPQIIIAGVGMGTGADGPLQFAKTETRLQNSEARRDNKVYPINSDLTNKAGPRIADALELFAELIHPELFK